ncbi:MAG: hypothetical protein ACJAT5_000510, partial [Lentimonas sp.]
MTFPSKAPPTFDRSFLLELAGGLVYKQAESLFETGAVISVEWESPLLTGVVGVNGERYEPKLNLRSTVFTQNNCNCVEGRRRKMCAHAIAIALHYEALKHEQISASQPHPDFVAEPSKPEVPKQASLKSIKLSAEGDKLRVLVFLPPNLESASKQDAVVVKLDAAVGREVVPLHQLSPTRSYAPSGPHLAVLSLVESWCGGKLASLLQLTGKRLCRLLAALNEEPVIYWVKKPDAPIQWQAGKLSGVHEFLPNIDLAELSDEDAEEPGATEMLERIVVKTPLSNRERAKPNPRRIAEARAGGTWNVRAGDYPVADAVSDSMNSFPADCIVVDGSQNFLAIRIPLNDDSIRPLRECLKSEGFMLEPSNRKWWLRDRHKTLNFLAAHWKELEEQWHARFTDNFKTKFAH